MTRIIAGRARGHRLEVPRTGTRPTADRLREALFASIVARWGDLDGAHVLDLFAGTGALGLEAVSRGAEAALLVDADRRTAGMIRGNVMSTGLREARVQASSVAAILAGPLPAEAPFDLVFADPPYADAGRALPRLLPALADPGWLADDALVVLEHPAREAAPSWPDGFTPWPTRVYGEAAFTTARWYRPAT